MSFKVLWDKTGGNSTCMGNGYLISLGKAILKLGGSITELSWPDSFEKFDLDSYDVLVISNRYESISGEGQGAIVRYVRNGGSLLVICEWSANMYSCNPVLINFGLQGTANRLGWTNMESFSHPATTARRPVQRCEVDYPYALQVTGKARLIAGRQNASPPGLVNIGIMGLGCNSGKGRVIALMDETVWSSHST